MDLIETGNGNLLSQVAGLYYLGLWVDSDQVGRKGFFYQTSLGYPVCLCSTNGNYPIKTYKLEKNPDFTYGTILRPPHRFAIGKRNKSQ